MLVASWYNTRRAFARALWPRIRTVGAEFSAERQTIAAKWLNCSQLNKCSNRISLTVCVPPCLSVSLLPLDHFFPLVPRRVSGLSSKGTDSFQQVFFFFLSFFEDLPRSGFSRVSSCAAFFSRKNTKSLFDVLLLTGFGSTLELSTRD